MKILKNTQLIPVLMLILVIRASGGQTVPENSSRAFSNDLAEAEELLSKLGYQISGVDGVADSSTRHAIIAFQKVEGLQRSGKLSPAFMESLRFAQRPTARFNSGAAHIEVDITRQVLFLTDNDGKVVYILPVSTGNEKPYFEQNKWQIAHTPRGRFKIERKINGIRSAPLGNLYFPNYFHHGVAVHGS